MCNVDVYVITRFAWLKVPAFIIHTLQLAVFYHEILYMIYQISVEYVRKNSEQQNDRGDKPTFKCSTIGLIKTN